MSPKRFGHYLVFRKVSRDPLGDTFRAGKIVEQAIEQLVFLRLFNGEGVASDRLWQQLSSAGFIPKTPDSPLIARSLEVGRLGGTVYASYRYVPSMDLATLAQRSHEKRSPFPVDLALLLGERMALALDAVAKARSQHGLLVPQWVSVSYEGQVQVRGFELSSGLREALVPGPGRKALEPYLSPEMRAGELPTAADDVYSLGAICYHLLAGRPLEIGADVAAQVDQAHLAADGSALSQPIADLLKAALAPRGQRLAEPSAWHQKLQEVMAQEQHTPRVFNLAFFLYSLFRTEIEREAEEVERERAAPVPPPPGAARPAATPDAAPGPAGAPPATGAAIPPPAVPTRPSREPLDDTSSLREKYDIGAEEASSKRLWMGVAAAVAAVVVGGALFWGLRGGDETEARGESAPDAVAAAGSVPASDPGIPPAAATEGGEAPAEEDASPSPAVEELETRMRELAAQASREVALREQYERQIETLRGELEAARQAEAAGDRAAAPGGAPAAVPASSGGAATAEVRPAGARSEVPSSQGPSAVTSSATVPSSQASSPPTTARPPTPLGTQEASGAAGGETAASGAAQPTPAEPAVQRGDLVTPGPDVVLPRIQQRPRPRYPIVAQRLQREATVVLRVLVDENGRVIQTERVSDPAGLGFDEAAEAAARETTWTPATKNDVPVKVWAELRIEFRP